MATAKLELRTALGPVYRDVLLTPPRNCTPDEIPVIDLEHLCSADIDKRKSVAQAIKSAAVNTGFFYIKNHGISQDVISKAKQQGLNFMRQSAEEKDLISSRKYSKSPGLLHSGQMPIYPFWVQKIFRLCRIRSAKT